MNFSDPRFWLDVVVILFSAANIAITWLRKPGQEAVEGVAKLRTHLDDQIQVVSRSAAEATTRLRDTTEAEHNELRKHVDEQHRETHTDLAVLRTHIEHMPTSDELSKLAGSVQALTASQEGFRNTQAQMTESLRRIENYLLNQK
jgi:hypothetical protein